MVQHNEIVHVFRDIYRCKYMIKPCDSLKIKFPLKLFYLKYTRVDPFAPPLKHLQEKTMFLHFSLYSLEENLFPHRCLFLWKKSVNTRKW